MVCSVRSTERCVFLDFNSLEDFLLLDIFKNVQFSFFWNSFRIWKCKKWVQSIMQWFGFFNEKVDCIHFFIILSKTDLGDFFVRILYLTILMKNLQKISKSFYCECCNYKCSKQSEYNKHISTAKHKNLTNPNNKSPNILQCICGKIYKHRSTLSAHKRVCKEYISVSNTTENVHRN